MITNSSKVQVVCGFFQPLVGLLCSQLSSCSCSPFSYLNQMLHICYIFYIATLGMVIIAVINVCLTSLFELQCQSNHIVKQQRANNSVIEIS